MSNNSSKKTESNFIAW